jgi:hypothetical protein
MTPSTGTAPSAKAEAGGYFPPESFSRYLMSAAITRMMMIQMAICIAVTFYMR